MTTFSRLVNSPIHAFQFKEIELDEAYKNSDLSVRIHHQLDAQFAAWREANLPVNTVAYLNLRRLLISKSRLLVSKI